MMRQVCEKLILDGKECSMATWPSLPTESGSAVELSLGEFTKLVEAGAIDQRAASLGLIVVCEEE